MVDKVSSDSNKGLFVTDGASVPTKLIKKGTITPVKPKPNSK